MLSRPESSSPTTRRLRIFIQHLSTFAPPPPPPSPPHEADRYILDNFALTTIARWIGPRFPYFSARERNPARLTLYISYARSRLRLPLAIGKESTRARG